MTDEPCLVNSTATDTICTVSDTVCMDKVCGHRQGLSSRHGGVEARFRRRQASTMPVNVGRRGVTARDWRWVAPWGWTCLSFHYH